ncbi:MAG TPA: hypothetical protein VFW95_07125 [Candidatus Limnocylindria bacterium]|nr:hypothetical protein [Candidatus Limnocylindria bacterium]
MPAEEQKWYRLYGPPKPRYTNPEIDAALARGADDSVTEALSAIKDEFERVIDAHSSVNARAGALPAVVAGLGVLSFSKLDVSSPLYGLALTALFTVIVGAVVATVCGFAALRAGKFGFGPDPILTAAAAGWPKDRFDAALLNSMARATQIALDSLPRKGWWFNFALEAGLVATLGALVLKTVAGGGE